MKFTPEGGCVDIRLQKNERTAVFVIRDDGYGISPESQRHIFDKFYQGDLSHAASGNGLGLSIARRVVTLHGGDIRCQSEEGAGTAFTVELPLS
ncbi:Sensor histidine kinase WalK [bioreactor metagenome]|uniref:histidine kinase n=1 Tax=bioreactor metagenome TaxID=1076179 RepID=A0A645F5B3_9ZZZZ